MLYQIHRYPADLIDVVRLRGGRRVVIRPVLPQDEELTRAFFRNLSGSDRYDRFLTNMRDVPPDLLHRFTHVDYAEHLALVAEVFGTGGETVVAEARYVRTDEDAAEFAVSVAEDWQGGGLATLLLTKLICRARAAGARRLVGETLASNGRMITLARKAGFSVRGSPDVVGLMLLEKTLSATDACAEAALGAVAA